MITSGLPGAGRNPLPIICRNNPSDRVGLASTMQPISGRSNPSVRTWQFETTSISPERSRVEDCIALMRVPSRCSARTSGIQNSSADVNAVRDVDGEDHRSPALRMFQPMLDDVADQGVGVHAVG